MSQIERATGTIRAERQAGAAAATGNSSRGTLIASDTLKLFVGGAGIIAATPIAAEAGLLATLVFLAETVGNTLQAGAGAAGLLSDMTSNNSDNQQIHNELSAVSIGGITVRMYDSVTGNASNDASGRSEDVNKVIDLLIFGFDPTKPFEAGGTLADKVSKVGGFAQLSGGWLMSPSDQGSGMRTDSQPTVLDSDSARPTPAGDQYGPPAPSGDQYGPPAPSGDQYGPPAPEPEERGAEDDGDKSNEASLLRIPRAGAQYQVFYA